MCRGELYAVIARLKSVKRVKWIKERSWRDSLALPLVSCESWIFVKKKKNRYKKNIQYTAISIAMEEVYSAANRNNSFSFLFFFLSGFSFTNIHDSQDSKGKGEGICLNPLYLLHRLHRHLDISRAITAECSHSSKDDKSIKFFVIVIKTGDFIHYLSKYLF